MRDLSFCLTWLAVALVAYAVTVVASVWRWSLLLEAQEVAMPFPSLLASMSVALFFNNFLPSNVGGDVIRVRDGSRLTGSTTASAESW